MVNETVPTSIQWAGQPPVWSANPLDLVNEKAAQNNNQLWAVWNKGFLDKIIGLIARMTWNPDPFTWKGGVVPAPKTGIAMENKIVAPEAKQDGQVTADVAGGLFGKFTSAITNIWNTVENLWNKAVWEATNVVNKWLDTAGTVWEKALGSATNVVSKGLETAGKVWEQAVNQAQQVAKQATDNVNEFVKLEEPKKQQEAVSWNTSVLQ